MKDIVPMHNSKSTIASLFIFALLAISAGASYALSAYSAEESNDIAETAAYIEVESAKRIIAVIDKAATARWEKDLLTVTELPAVEYAMSLNLNPAEYSPDLAWRSYTIKPNELDNNAYSLVCLYKRHYEIADIAFMKLAANEVAPKINGNQTLRSAYHPSLNDRGEFIDGKYYSTDHGPYVNYLKSNLITAVCDKLTQEMRKEWQVEYYKQDREQAKKLISFRVDS